MSTTTNVVVADNSKPLDPGFDAKEFFGKNPLCRVIHALMETPFFVSNTRWISEAVDASEKEVKKALTTLVHCGLISDENGNYKLLHKKVYQHTSSVDAEHRFTSHRTATMHIMTRLREGFRHTLYNGVQATDEKTFWKLAKKVEELQEWFELESDKGSKDLLIGYSFMGSDVLNDIKGVKNAH